MSGSLGTCTYTVRMPRLVTFEIAYVKLFSNGTLVVTLDNVGQGSGVMVRATTPFGNARETNVAVGPSDRIALHFDSVPAWALGNTYRLDIRIDHDELTSESTWSAGQRLRLDVPETPWEENYMCRVPITIRERSGTRLTDYTVKVTITSGAILSRSSGTDLLFVRYDGLTPNYLPHWVEQWTASSAAVWVKVDEIPRGGSATIYMYLCPTSPVPDRSSLPTVISVNDGWPQYVYQIYEMSTGGLVGGGTGRNWNRNDDEWRLNLPWRFPYYDNSYSRVRVGSNGYICLQGFCGDDRTSTERDLARRRMIAGLWADLWPDNIYTRTGTDVWGQYYVVRWDGAFTAIRCIIPPICFALKTGTVNFEVMLYRNGIIRVNYGEIQGSSTIDDTALVGVSEGGRSTCTLPRCTLYAHRDAETFDSHNSVVFWPRRYTSPEPSVMVGALEVDP